MGGIDSEWLQVPHKTFVVQKNIDWCQKGNAKFYSYSPSKNAMFGNNRHLNERTDMGQDTVC